MVKKTKLINFLQKKGIKVKHLSRKLKVNDLKGIDLIISFGYNQILGKNIKKSEKTSLKFTYIISTT